MEYLLIGKYVNTHGLNGEIRIMSDFRYKESILKSGMSIYIGDEKHPYIINGYRRHKQYDMITLEGINNINDIELLKGNYVYINKSDLKLDNNTILIEDLIDYEVYINDNFIGNVIDVIKTKANDVLVVGEKRILIPYVKEYILDIDNNDRKIKINDVRGLI